jgi:Protein of unknown function (DUF3617)
MLKTSVWKVVSCCALTVAILAFAQARPKPGLWEMTTNSTWQVSPYPAASEGMPDVSRGWPIQVCVTQEMIDLYGGPLPRHNKECQASNVKIIANGMTAEWVCRGTMTGKGTVQSSWIDENHVTTRIHFTGTERTGPVPQPSEWTRDTKSVYKGSGCGRVKPMVQPK